MSIHTHHGSTAAVDVSLSEVLAGLDVLGVSVVVTDLAGKILVWSDSASALFGWTADQVLGHDAAHLTRWGISQADAACVLLTGDGEPWSGLTDVVVANGDVVPVRMTAGLAGADKELVLSLAQRGDMSPRRTSQLDPLTGLPNRASVSDQLALRQSPREAAGAGLAVLFADVDHFRLVNDNRGHATGDALLVAIARRLTSLSPETCTVARVGDDEFVIVCPDTDAHEARRFADTVRKAFDDPCDAGGLLIPVSLSIGIATTDDVPAGDLLQSAERALTWAKSGGSGRTEVHNASMPHSTRGHLQLLTDLQQAIKAGQLAVHYQPIVQIDGHMTGVEALLRWRHPRHGAVAPAEIVPLAEDNGLMPALGEWILNRACADIAAIPSRHAAGLHVAVNLSARQLTDENIVDTVDRALRRSGLAPERLVLEVTETSVIEDPETTSRQLQALKDLGVRLALDDFGTGYSSLVHLRRFPIDIIKIDRSFVSGMGTNKHDFAIVASLTNLARTVGLIAVAEGVESSGQADTLRLLGASCAQGYLWSRAVPISQLAGIVRRDAIAELGVGEASAWRDEHIA
ncbi:MAG: histidine kinase [Frankiales bacterium]|nr:histidine kinase [Frankiales bacterium]